MKLMQWIANFLNVGVVMRFNRGFIRFKIDASYIVNYGNGLKKKAPNHYFLPEAKKSLR